MGNCQAVDAAALVIQHPSGKLERMYWPVTVCDVMKMNPGHYVSLIIPLPASADGSARSDDDKIVRFTRVKLLRPSDTLVLGRAYRLVTTQEVMKVVRAKKYAKLKKCHSESAENRQNNTQGELPVENLAIDQERGYGTQRQRQGSTNSGRFKSWQPSLQSIPESGS